MLTYRSTNLGVKLILEDGVPIGRVKLMRFNTPKIYQYYRLTLRGKVSCFHRDQGRWINDLIGLKVVYEARTP